jgi:hypothetical protein
MEKTGWGGIVSKDNWNWDLTQEHLPDGISKIEMDWRLLCTSHFLLAWTFNMIIMVLFHKGISAVKGEGNLYFLFHRTLDQ